MSAAPTPVLCIERERLVKAFAKAVSDLNRMHTAQIAAIARNEDFRFEEEIAEADRVRENAKYAILQHREGHGC
jgi:hypothetical protein